MKPESRSAMTRTLALLLLVWRSRATPRMTGGGGGAFTPLQAGSLHVAGTHEWVYGTSEHSACMWAVHDCIFLPVNLS